jgi:hypothetical protein
MSLHLPLENKIVVLTASDLKSGRLASGLALFGMVNVPLVYFAVNFWKTQHPTNNVVPSLRGQTRQRSRQTLEHFDRPAQVFLGLVVGGIVIAMFLPIFNHK